MEHGNKRPVPHVNAIYYPSWRVYRGHNPSAIPIQAVTHLYYAFCRPGEDGSIVLLDEHADLRKEVDGFAGCLRACINLRQANPSLRLILSIGGGSGSKNFAGVAKDERLRLAFAQSSARALALYEFDGIDVDWEHPDSTEDALNFVALLQAIRTALPAGTLLTAALPAGEWLLRLIPMREAMQSLDFLNLMAYDFAGPWTNGQSGHHAQLFAPKTPHNAFARRSGAGAVEYLARNGVPRSKIVLGIPLYGRSFLGAGGPGEKFTGCGGDDGIVEFKDLPGGAEEYVDAELGAAWCLRRNSQGGKEWISYDNVATLQMKAEFCKSAKLGGLFYWSSVGDKEGPDSLVAAGFEFLGDARSLR